jgi:16S rRNA (adenine1518-N6/adenine1519-N6)-dimethyltransferase
LLNLNPIPESVTLLVQKEVAERMVAKPGQMSLLALAVQMKSQPELVFHVLARSFYPMPKVDSAVIRLQVIGDRLQGENQDEEMEKQIFKITRAAFRGKRKTLLNSLSGNLGLSKEEVETTLSKCNINPKTRPQELNIEEWMNLTKFLIP